MAEQLLTPHEVASWARVSEKTVLREISRGHLAARRIGYRWRVSRDDLERWGTAEDAADGEVIALTDARDGLGEQDGDRQRGGDEDAAAAERPGP
jgi:excisionase family DNA binding protein